MTISSDYRYYLFLGANAPISGTGQIIVSTKDFAGAANDLVLSGATVSANGSVTWHTSTADTTASYTGFTAPDGGPIILLPPAYLGGPNQYYALTNQAYTAFTQVTPIAATSFACFVSGTLIATPEGEVAVEDLRAGQRVSLALGGSAEIAWIGWRKLDGADPLARPIRVRAHCFGFGQPARDLFLSPDHAVYRNEVLIPIKALINGSSIAVADLAAVTYFHVLLERHEVIVAEGLACESLLDITEPVTFANADTAPPSLAFLAPFAPIVTQGPVVELVRARVRQEEPVG